MNKPRPPADFDDNPEWTDEDFARARPASETQPPHVVGALVRKRGRPAGSKNASTKEQIALRVDPDVLAAYRATGPGWHGRMNEALREGVRRFGVLEAGGKFSVVERTLKKVPSDQSMGSYVGGTRWVEDAPNEDAAHTAADRMNRKG